MQPALAQVSAKSMSMLAVWAYETRKENMTLAERFEQKQKRRGTM